MGARVAGDRHGLAQQALDGPDVQGCGPNQTCCKGRCANLKRNEHHCGSCSNRCDEGEECVEGVCAPACVSEGGSCSTTGGTPCCSGTCNNNGFCCPDGRVGLSNGTCAISCGTIPGTPGCTFCGVCVGSASTGGGLCTPGLVSGSHASCATDAACPRGEFCLAESGACIAAC
jgi:Stigma-specific protein, Stig1